MIIYNLIHVVDVELALIVNISIKYNIALFS